MDELMQEYRQALRLQMGQAAGGLRRLLAGVPSQQIAAQPRLGGWSLHQEAAHLRNMQAGLFLPIIAGLSEGNLAAQEVMAATAGEQDHYHSAEALEAILLEYERLWARELALLDELPAETWNRRARHPRYGLRTLQWWAEQSLAHAMGHLRSMQSRMAGEQSANERLM